MGERQWFEPYLPLTYETNSWSPASCAMSEVYTKTPKNHVKAANFVVIISSRFPNSPSFVGHEFDGFGLKKVASDLIAFKKISKGLNPSYTLYGKNLYDKNIPL